MFEDMKLLPNYFHFYFSFFFVEHVTYLSVQTNLGTKFTHKVTLLTTKFKKFNAYSINRKCINNYFGDYLIL